MTIADRENYPICPRCGSPIAIALMTSKSANPFGDGNYYHPDGISARCTSASCNHDLPAWSIPSPPPSAPPDTR